MAVLFSNGGAGFDNSCVEFQRSVTMGSGTNRMLIVSVITTQDVGWDTDLSVECGGEGVLSQLTLLTSLGYTGNYYMSIWYLLEPDFPPSGDNYIRAVFNSITTATAMSWAFFSDVKQQAPTNDGSFNLNTTSVTSPSLTTLNGSMLFAAIGLLGVGDITAGTGQKIGRASGRERV